MRKQIIKGCIVMFGSLAGLLAASAQLPVITGQPQSASVVLDYPAALSVSANNGPLSYQWRKESVPIPGATTSALTLASARYIDAGTYSVLVSNATGGLVSSNAALTVTPPGPGALELFFNPGANRTVQTVAVQPDGKIVVGGWFTQLGGQARTNLGRLNADGTLDSSVNPGANNTVWALAVQADGKILVGGGFTQLSGQARNCLGRLNADGTLDTSFNPVGNGGCFTLAVQADGRILAGGWFIQLGGQERNNLGRLNADGTLDTSFNPDPNDFVYTLTVQADGKILVGGAFTQLAGQPRNYLGRLNANGTLDTSFNPGANGSVQTLAVEADGKILVGGNFTQLGGQARTNLGRLNANGTLDTNFTAGANGSVQTLAVQADGKILVGGAFTQLGGQARNGIGRLNADGTLDTSFNPGANGSVYTLAAQADGKVLVGGSFTELGGQARDRIGRLFGAADLYDVVDADGDGLPSAWEWRYGLHPEVPNLEIGTGRDGSLTVGDSDCYTDEVWARVVGSNPAGQASLNVSTTNGFAVSNLVLMITMQDPNTNLNQNMAGTFEFGRIATLGSSSFTVAQPRANALNATNSEKIQVLKVPEYTDVTFTSGSALSFDGVDDYVDLPDGVYFSGGDFTIETWLYPKVYSTYARVVEIDNGQNLGNSAVILSFCDALGAMKPVLAVGTTNGPVQIFSSFTLQSNTWVHLAVSVRGTNVTFFTNGIFAASGGLRWPPQSVMRTNNMIAKSNYAEPNAKVMLDELRIWSVARTRYEIAVNMRRTLTGQEPGLVACYSFNESSGTIAHDSGPNHLHGSFVSSPTWAPSAFGWLTCHPWNGTNGGVLAFLAHSINLGGGGAISADGKGYRGGTGVPEGPANKSYGISGEGTTGFSLDRASSVAERPQGGGGASQGAAASGAGGGYGSPGGSGYPGGDSSVPGIGAGAFGFSDLRRLYPGGGGGGSGSHLSGRVGVAGGAGGGVVFVAARSIEGSGVISSQGAPGAQGIFAWTPGGTSGAGGGGGAGGSIYVIGTVPSSLEILADGGTGGPHASDSECTSKDGGPGGVGRIRLDIPASTPAPTFVSPAPGSRTQLSAANPVISPIWSPLDSDHDGLSDVEEYLQGTDLYNPDQNGNGLPDGWEAWAGCSPTNTLNPLSLVPGDQLTYFQKFAYGLNPLTRDTDGDTVSDYNELFIYHTDPLHVEPAPGIQYFYDALDRLTGAQYTNGLLLRYDYDPNNNIVRQAYLQSDATGNGLPDFWESLNGLTNDASAYIDSDGDGWTDYQEWRAGTDPKAPRSHPYMSATATTIASTNWPFTPSSFVVGVGQVNGTGPEQIVIGADGNPGTATNFLLVLSQTDGGWTNIQRVSVGPFGVTSIAVGPPANRPPAIYVGLRQAGGSGRIMEFVQAGGVWTSNGIAMSTNEAAFVLGVRPSQDVVVSLAATNSLPGTAYYLKFASDLWTMTRANPVVSGRGLGTVLVPNPQGVSRQAARLLDSGGVQAFGGLPATARYHQDYSRWFFLTPQPLGWEPAQAYASRIRGNLATVNDANLDDWLWNEFGGATGFWIGLFREVCGDPQTPWQWASGVPFSYTRWGPNQPSCSGSGGWERFVVLSSFGGWPGNWGDFAGDGQVFGLIETPVDGPYSSAPEPACSSRLLWRGLSLASAHLRPGNTLSVMYSCVEDQNSNGVADAGDNLVVAEYLLNACDLNFSNVQRVPLSGPALAQSYGLAGADVLYSDRQALFTAEPDGRVYMWSATNATAPLQRLLFSDTYAGKGWHGLVAVKGLEPGQSLAGLSVDPANPSRCEVILWPPPQQKPEPVPADMPQTAPITCILAANPASGAVSVDLMIWDAEGNVSRPELQYRLAGQPNWSNATNVIALDGTNYTPHSFVETHPNGRLHQLSWNAAGDLPPGYADTLALRARSADITLTGPWSPPLNYAVQPPGGILRAANDVVFTSQNTPVLISVLANDSGQPKHFFAVGTPAHGSAVITTNQWINYSPAHDFAGTDQFVYTITDGAGAYSMATVTVMVTDVSQPIVLQAPSTAGGQFSMEILGLPGQVYELQASTNLIDWVSMRKVTNFGGIVPFTDPIQTNSPTRFYRARLVP